MAECPYQSSVAASGGVGGRKKPMTVRDWWPDALDLRM